jgi:hypothetical protein
MDMPILILILIHFVPDTQIIITQHPAAVILSNFHSDATDEGDWYQ